jgi:hypothetical protein
MRGIVLSLAAVSGLGAVLLGGRAVAAGGGEPARSTAAATTVPATRAADEGRLWYGGTLAPIVVVASAPQPVAARQGHECLRAGS